MNKLFKFLCLGVMLFLIPKISKADPTLLVNLGKLNIYIPLTSIDVVYQYDFVGKRSLVGGETSLANYKQITLTGGAVTSVDGQGSPFLGIHLALTNPTENWVPLASLHPGLFGGRDFNNNAWLLGIKASINIFGN